MKRSVNTCVTEYAEVINPHIYIVVCSPLQPYLDILVTAIFLYRKNYSAVFFLSEVCFHSWKELSYGPSILVLICVHSI